MNVWVWPDFSPDDSPQSMDKLPLRIDADLLIESETGNITLSSQEDGRRLNVKFSDLPTFRRFMSNLPGNSLSHLQRLRAIGRRGLYIQVELSGGKTLFRHRHDGSLYIDYLSLIKQKFYQLLGR